MTIFKENIVDTSLIGPILTALLAAAGFYCKFWFTRYQASRDQAQKVSRAIEDVLSKMAALFGQKKPARILREEFSAVIGKRLVRTVLIFTESSDQLSRATDRVPGLPASPGYVQ